MRDSRCDYFLVRFGCFSAVLVVAAQTELARVVKPDMLRGAFAAPEVRAARCQVEPPNQRRQCCVIEVHIFRWEHTH